MARWDKLNRFLYNYDEELISHDSKSNMDKFVIQNLLGTSYTITTSGIFLSGFLLYLGASEEITSYISVIGSICGLFSMFFAGLVRKVPTRKRLLLTVNLISKTLTVSSIIVPLFLPENIAVFAAFFMILTGAVLMSVNTIIFNTWFAAIIPKNIMGRFFGVRHMVNVFANIFIPVLASLFIDFMRKSSLEYGGFLIIFSFAAVCGLAELMVFKGIDDVKLKTEPKKTKLSDCFRLPLKNKDFMNFLVRAALVHIAFYIGATFHQVYILKYLKLSYSYYNTITIISPVVQIFLMLKFWGIITDKLNSGFVFYICGTIMALDMLLWTFITPTTAYFIFPLLFVVSAVEWSGFNITIFSRRYEFMPEDDRVLYDSFYTFVIGLVLFLCPILGNFVRGFSENLTFLDNITFGKVRFLFFVSALLTFLVGVFNITSFKKTEEGAVMKDPESFRFCKMVLRDILRRNWKILLIIITIIILLSFVMALFT